MINQTGHFVISLDYELHWGFFDHKSVDDYKENLTNVNLVINKLLELSDAYNVRLTFSTVGFLFAKNKAELIKYSPIDKPKYKRQELNPYAIFDEIGDNEAEDPFHYANSIIQEIKAHKIHEIGTHTFGHYYTLEHGQTLQDFENDIKSAVAIAKANEVEVKSIVFPRNMINRAYLDVCYTHGITSYRGTEKSYTYNVHPVEGKYHRSLFRLVRLLDSYFNITGSHTHKLQPINNGQIINIPSSRFLRAYQPKLKFLESLKISRIKKGMETAAKNKKLYHLWWHPHNFGVNIDENFNNLENIFKEYKRLQEKYNFTSETMTSLSGKLHSKSN